MRNVLKDHAFGRFLVIGVAATGVHYAVLTLLIEVARVRSAGLANGCAAIFGITASYIGARFFVFRSRLSVAQTLPCFLLTAAGAACLHTLVLAVWTDIWRLPYPVGFLIATAASTVLNFLASRFIVFADLAARHQR